MLASATALDAPFDDEVREVAEVRVSRRETRSSAAAPSTTCGLSETIRPVLALKTTTLVSSLIVVRID